jgi:catechol 2,3-dioxygenase-like lactoylglutathione lyase family enzyme
MEFIRVAHVQITIPTAQEHLAKEFYIQNLGLREIEKPASLQGRGGFWLEVGSIQIHVGTEDGVAREKTKAHISYVVSNLEAVREKLEREGFVISSGPEIPEFARFETRDPFGNRIEFMESRVGPA